MDELQDLCLLCWVGCCDLVNYLIRRVGVKVVEGLNVLIVLNVITFSPICSKLPMQSFNSFGALLL